MDWAAFWSMNQRCMSLKEGIQRVPVLIDIPGDWVCLKMQLDNAKYYSDFEYQYDARCRCNELLSRELGIQLTPQVDFGVVQDASIYGGKVHYDSHATPTLTPVLEDPSEIPALIDRMDKTDPLDAGLVPQYLQWREAFRKRTGISLPYGKSQKGAATMLGQLCSITNFLTWILTDPEEIRLLIECWQRTSIRYLTALRKETGTDACQDAFSIQSDVTGLMSGALYRESLMQAELALYNAFATDVGAIRYYHADSHMLQHLDALREIGVNQVNIDPYIEPAAIMEKIPGVIIHGQIPPTSVLLYGTAEEIQRCVKRDIEQAGPTRQLILTTAGSINPGTPMENLYAMCEAVERWGYIYE